ncbi:PIN domain-containing protein [Rhodovulum strictum]|uniref:Ribonuclease VapC n=1 Tax=Rhodovulum strictum TaxID=58314 RepID=A0A844BDL3_9RHOB|nr:PIN domain-containing protein [Rhodovulum strictum]
MIAIDTNVLVRFLTQDDPDQARAATNLMNGLGESDPGFVCREVVVELVWVLERAYGFGRSDVARALEGLLSAAEIVVEAADDVGRTAFRYREGGFGFADLMIAAAARRQDAVPLVTFDRKAARIPGVELLTH